MYAYDESYMSYAQRTLGGALHYAVHDLKMNADEFFAMFINSKIAYSFGLGEAKYVLGMSGTELAMETIFVLTGKCPNKKPSYALYKNPRILGRLGFGLFRMGKRNSFRIHSFQSAGQSDYKYVFSLSRNGYPTFFG